MKKVFIGSSSEQKDTMREIACWLEEFGVEPVLWSDIGVFVPGCYTLDALVKQSQEVDAAIFVFSDDDKIWYRNDLIGTVRDNVLLEYGLFCGRLSRKNVIMVVKGSTRIATDLEGITYIDITNRNSANRKLKNWLESIRLINNNYLHEISIGCKDLMTFDQKGYASKIFAISDNNGWTEIQVDYSSFGGHDEPAYAGVYVNLNPAGNISIDKEITFEICFLDDNLDQILLELKGEELKHSQSILIRKSDIQDDGKIHIKIDEIDSEVATNLSQIVFCTYPGHFSNMECKNAKYRIRNFTFDN